MSMRPTDRRRLILMAVLATAAAVAFLLARSRPHEPEFPPLIEAEPPSEAARPTSKDPGVVVVKNPPAVAAPAPDQPPGPRKMPSGPRATFAAAYRECFPEAQPPGSPRDYLRDMATRGELARRETHLENLHIRTEGVERRLQSRWRTHGQEIQYFDVDAEGLPLSKGAAVLMTHDQAAEQKQRFLSRGEPIFRQRTEAWHLKNGQRLMIDWRDDEPFEFSTTDERGTLGCREADCLCRLRHGGRGRAD